MFQWIRKFFGVGPIGPRRPGELVVAAVRKRGKANMEFQLEPDEEGVFEILDTDGDVVPHMSYVSSTTENAGIGEFISGAEGSGEVAVLRTGGEEGETNLTLTVRQSIPGKEPVDYTYNSIKMFSFPEGPDMAGGLRMTNVRKRPTTSPT